MCLIYNLTVPFEKLPVFPLVHYQQVGSRRNYLALVSGLSSLEIQEEWRDPILSLATLLLPTSTPTLTTQRMWNLFSTVST